VAHHRCGDALTNNQAQAILENTVTGQHVLWVLNNGAYSFTIALPAVSPQWRVAAVADFLGNDQADIVLENTVTGQHVLWILNHGSYCRHYGFAYYQYSMENSRCR